MGTNGTRNGGGASSGAVVVADSDNAIRKTVTRLLAVVGFDVHEAETGTAALLLSRELRPAAVLLDVVLPEISGYQVCHLLRAEYGASLPILLLSETRTEPHDMAAGLLIGATDYLVKPFSPDELVARVSAHTRTTPARHVNGSPWARLTPSERRVLGLLADGMSTKGIAQELSITTKTVAMHVHNAMKKLDVHSRSQAVALVHRLGIASDAQPRLRAVDG